jgi:hypothetical protein
MITPSGKRLDTDPGAGGAGQAIQERRGMSRGLMKEGIEALDTALERHVERGDCPGG